MGEENGVNLREKRERRGQKGSPHASSPFADRREELSKSSGDSEANQLSSSVVLLQYQHRIELGDGFLVRLIYVLCDAKLIVFEDEEVGCHREVVGCY